MERMLIAERGTDWLRALRCLSLSSRPFTTLVQAEDDQGFLRVRPWDGAAPREIVLLCASALTAGVMESRLALLRHVSGHAGTKVCVVTEDDDGQLAMHAFLEVVRSLAPEMQVQVTSLGALAARGGSQRASVRPAAPFRRAA